MLIAAAITVSTIGGASAANAATPADATAALSQAAAEAHRTASAALGGLALPTGTAAQLRTAATAKVHVESLHSSLPVKVAKHRYDIRFASVGTSASPTRIHGAKTATLATTTTFRRFVVMLTDLESGPLMAEQKRFATRASLVAALSHGLAIGGGEVTREYGALLRLAQMSLDLSTSLVAAIQYSAKHPTATDFSGVVTTHTTRGSGAYAGSVVVSGTPTSFSGTATNTTDDSSIAETFDEHSITITYTVPGTSTTVTV
jgi:hypothetical protein